MKPTPKQRVSETLSSIIITSLDFAPPPSLLYLITWWPKKVLRETAEDRFVSVLNRSFLIKSYVLPEGAAFNIKWKGQEASGPH